MDAVVSDILRSRMQEPGGLKQTAAVSLALHAAAVAVLVVMPGMLPKKQTAPPVIMNISLGGTPGPRTGGQMMLGGRAIPAAAATTAPRVDTPAAPAVKEAPAMVLPIPDSKIRPKTPPKPTATAKETAPAIAGRGFDTPQPGSTKIDTGAKGMGFGLSSGGGGGTGSHLDVQNFCCPEYLSDMVDRIYARWNQQQQSTGEVMMKYTILRNGTIANVEVERSSNLLALDLESQRALTNTRLAPLPAEFRDDHLTVHLLFQYERKR